ncbi:MAG: hypothetical protein OEZ23_08940 [Gammaproteobacteria bacterium]|nr:hypothetical protein [Gammaproteobacteria bacterium]
MHEEIVPIIIVPAFFLMIAYIFATLSNNRVRRMIIDSQSSEELANKLLLQTPKPDTDVALKHGLVAVSIGLSFILIQVMRLDAGDAMTYGILFLFGGAGMLGYYGLARFIQSRQ